MKILIAGRSGLIGSFLHKHLDEHLLLTCIDNSVVSDENDIINLDLTDIYKVERFAKNCDNFDVLIFLVGLAHAKGKGKDLPEFKKVNYETLVNTLSSFQKYGKIPGKIVFASTISIYGEKIHQTIYSEDSPHKPFSPYAVTKWDAEKYLIDNFKVKSWILRFAPVYSSKFLLNIDRRTRIGDKFYRVGDGNKRMSLCNIDNIGVVISAIISEILPHGVYNLSDPKEYSYNELLNFQRATRVIRIPVFLIRWLYYYGSFVNSIFLKENSIKLISDNIFPSDKIRALINYSATLDDVEIAND